MLCSSSAKALCGQGFVALLAFALCAPALAQTSEIQPREINRDITDFIVEPPRLVLPDAPRDKIIARIKQGPIDWQAAYDQLTEDIQPFRPRPQSTTMTTNQPSAFQANERVLRTMGDDVQRVSPNMGSVTRPKLPILLPPDPPMLAAYKRMAPDFPDARALDGVMAFFHGLDDHYAATFEMDGLDIMINGSRIEFTSEARRIRRDQSRTMSDGTRMLPIERDDVGVSLSFNRFGAAYMIEIACTDPQTDARCSEDGFITEVYKKLLLFGGRP